MNINAIKTDLKSASKELKQLLTPEQIAYGQAVSVCSVVVEMGLQRASLEDVVDGMEQRFEGLIDRDEIQDVAEGAIAFGMRMGLMQVVDEESFSLTDAGMFVGNNWLMEIRQDTQIV